MFSKGSRYEGVPDLSFVDGDGRVIRYKAARETGVPGAVAGHRVVSGERLDHIAYRYYRDAERWWRVCDANAALWPDDLLEVGQVIRIPAAEG